MKKLILTLLFSIPTFSQVGIGTTNPTETLDVNGTLKVSDLTDPNNKAVFTVQADIDGKLSRAPYKAVAMAVVGLNANIYKSFGVANVVRVNTTTYRVTFTTALPNNDYVINFSAKQRLLSYDNVTVNGFDIIVNTNPNPIANFDFNFAVFLIY